MKRILFSILTLAAISLPAKAQLKEITDKAQKTLLKDSGLKTTDIAAALKEALNKGVNEQVTKLTATDGFYKNDAVKILLPDELQKVDERLRKLGMGELMDQGVLLLNRAAETAVKEGTPIFVDAITQMSFKDAKTILTGPDNAATSYLIETTAKPLYDKFSPVVKNSLNSVGADVVWKQIIGKYNTLPLVGKVNPDLTDYVTHGAMKGVYRMIAVEEKNIRTDLASRTSDLLKKVFALQD